MASNLTYNFEQWHSRLSKARNQVLPTALVNVEQKLGTTLNDMLWKEIEFAIKINPEFDYPEYKEGLRKVAYNPNVVFMTIRDVGRRGETNNILIVDVEFEAYAGKISEYAAAVEAARSEYGTTTIPNPKNPDKTLIVKTSRAAASQYWKNFIYRQAREDFAIKYPRRPGQRGRTPTHKKEGKQLYKATIKDRFANMPNPAPFWEILDKGIAGASDLNKGGTAYPEAKPTNFLRVAREKIKAYVTRLVNAEQNRLYNELEKTNYGGENILEQLDAALGRFETTITPFEPGKVLVELELGERRYNAYVTKSGRLGLSRG